jgi:hypothetical protein
LTSRSSRDIMNLFMVVYNKVDFIYCKPGFNPIGGSPELSSGKPPF